VRRGPGSSTPQKPRVRKSGWHIPSPLRLASIPTEPNQLQLLLRFFYDFLEKIGLLITHNGSNYNFRTEISAGASEVELAFSGFFKLASQQCAMMPILQQCLKPAIASSTSALRNAAMPFRRKWHKFA
jgi:hypothetical protein